MEITEFLPRISPPVFSILIHSAFSHPQLAQFCSRQGMEVPGFRLEKVDTLDLIRMVYEDCSLPGSLAVHLQEALDRKFQDKITRVAALAEKKIRNIFFDGEIAATAELVGYLWAAWRDPRRKVNRQAVKFHDYMDDHFAGRLPLAAAADGDALSKEAPAAPVAAAVLPSDLSAEAEESVAGVLSGLEQLGEEWRKELRKLEKYLKKNAAEAEKARRTAEKRKKEVRDRNDQIRTLREELKVRKKELQEREKELSASSPALAAELELQKSRFHNLERESRKKDHEIAELIKIREKNSAIREKLAAAGAELASARRRIEAAEARGRELESEAAGLREKIARLEKSRGAVFTRPRPPQDRERLGIYYDSRNIYYTVRNTFAGGRVDIEEMMTRISRGRKVVRAIAYVVQADFDNKQPYFDLLVSRGFQVKRRNLKVRLDGSMKGDWDMGIALDLIRHSDDLDTIALVSGDGDFQELAVFLKRKGVRVEVYGVESCTALDLKQVADSFVPIDQRWLFHRPSA